MEIPQPQLRFDAAAYLAWEAEQAERHQYVNGEVFAMTGGRDAHNRVALNIAAALKDAVKGTPCRTYVADMKLHIDAADACFYPDEFVTCDERDRSTGRWPLGAAPGRRQRESDAGITRHRAAAGHDLR